MRDAAFVATMVLLLPLAVARPFVGVLLLTWLLLMGPERLVYGPAASMPWLLMVFATTLFGCLLAGEPRRLPLNATTLLILALMGLFTVTALVAPSNPAASLAKWEGIETTLVALLLTAAMLTDRRRLHALVWVMVIAIGYYGVRSGVLSAVSGGAYRQWAPEGLPIAERGPLATAAVVALPLMNYLRLQSRNAVARVGLVGAMGLCLLAVLGSGSRGALLALAAACVAYGWTGGRRVLPAGLTAAAVAVALILSPLPLPLAGGEGASLDLAAATPSAAERLATWENALRLALVHPFSGAGFAGLSDGAVVEMVSPGSPGRAAGSIWFEVLGETGFLALAAWAALTLTGLVQARRLAALPEEWAELAWARDLGRMAIVSIVAYLVGGSFFSLAYWHLPWALVVALASATAILRRSEAMGRAEPGAWFPHAIGGLPKEAAVPELLPDVSGIARSAAAR
ncbi:putative O-glycosylation ligase, exosortase A system-associated [Roseomonas sp. KE2513]|uniref:putative O-glycosylation ligase, exosortase A system-associated n=1 Tax=Roseomonas sp. KE2513 TaxID=2479202 RepID=UPI0018E040BC|nr:putative O-glycosylation ligase, exosortase A system-associated [Roseomonas sp. KE2513]MBI0537612.1 putative O-glycosylation ligase, exosortase A system-associated [Roseomonas sp. KE2513]